MPNDQQSSQGPRGGASGDRQAAQSGTGGEPHNSASGSSDEAGRMNDTAQASDQQSGDIDFSEQESAAGSPRTAQDSGSAPQVDGNSAGSVGESGSPGSPARSHEEEVAVLERELEGSMGEYDGMILRERRNVLKHAGEEGSEEQVEEFDRSVAYYEEGDLSESGAGQEGAQSTPGTPGGQGGGAETGSQAGGHPNGSDAGGPGRANDQAYAPPDDIPSGDDDDVVARQIREAALYEDDPELREKLWEEYRKYKEQS